MNYMFSSHEADFSCEKGRCNQRVRCQLQGYVSARTDVLPRPTLNPYVACTSVNREKLLPFCIDELMRFEMGSDISGNLGRRIIEGQDVENLQ